MKKLGKLRQSSEKVRSVKNLNNIHISGLDLRSDANAIVGTVKSFSLSVVR